jgi:hypothetical protein
MLFMFLVLFSQVFNSLATSSCLIFKLCDILSFEEMFEEKKVSEVTKVSKVTKVAEKKKAVDPFIAGFYESMAETNIEKITKGIMADLSEDSDDSDEFDVESGDEDFEDQP